MLSLITAILAVIGGATVLLVVLPLFGWIIIPALMIVAVIACPIMLGFLIGRLTKEKGDDKKE